MLCASVRTARGPCREQQAMLLHLLRSFISSLTQKNVCVCVCVCLLCTTASRFVLFRKTEGFRCENRTETVGSKWTVGKLQCFVTGSNQCVLKAEGDAHILRLSSGRFGSFRVQKISC